MTRHGEGAYAAAIDRDGNILVTDSTDGIVRIGSISGDEPHLLSAHT